MLPWSTREEHFMVKPTREVKNTTVEIEGLDDVFEVDYRLIDRGPGTVPAPIRDGANDRAEQGVGLSLKAASIHYKLAISTLRMKIKRGEISAKKVDGVNGPEWRVFPFSAPFTDPNTHGTDQGIQQGVTTTQARYQRTLPEHDNRLLDLIEKQSAKLEAAAGQIGYFKSQIDSYQEQVKLLPDLQAQAARARVHEEKISQLEGELGQIKASWWYRFCAWFLGGSV